jgi:hypothetical protein
MYINSTTVLAELARAKEQAVATVVGGRCQDFPAYRHMSGYIEGLDKAYATIMESFGEERDD